MSRIFLHHPNSFAPGYYFSRLPAFHTYQELTKRNIELYWYPDLNQDETFYDAYVFHNFPTDAILHFLGIAKHNDKKICWIVDDDYYHIEPTTPTHEYYLDKSRLDLMKDFATLIITSTEQLKQVIDQPEKTIVAPLLIEPSSFPQTNKWQQTATNVLWCGSMFHGKDLDILVEPITKLSQEYEDKVSFTFWGCLPDAFAHFDRHKNNPEQGRLTVKPEFTNIRYMPGTEFRYFFDILPRLQPDIALAPLQHNQFNNCKTNLKYLEYSLAGAAMVATDCIPYHQSKALLVDNTTNAWRNAIKTLIDNPQQRQELHNQAKADVLANYTWSNARKRNTWLEVFTMLGTDNLNVESLMKSLQS